MDQAADVAGIAALGDATRRALYAYVVAQPGAVGREEVATALDLPQHRVSFHLDRLVEEGLLEVEFRRLTGRTGPGAGRPSKLYRRAEREFAVALPPRRYDLVGDILAAAVSRAATTLPLDRALEEAARAEGEETGRTAVGADTTDPLRAVADVLAPQGYEPRIDDGEMVLTNCPFDALARKHTALVCGLNRDYVQGVADGLGCEAVTARLFPAPDTCCVRARAD
jgi:predicted ArsR family transcriptional regulator